MSTESGLMEDAALSIQHFRLFSVCIAVPVVIHHGPVHYKWSQRASGLGHVDQNLKNQSL